MPLDGGILGRIGPLREVASRVQALLAVNDGAPRPVDGQAVRGDPRWVNQAQKVGDPAYLSALEQYVNDEVVLPGIVAGDSTAEAVAVHLFYVPHEPSQQVDGVAGAAEKEVLRYFRAPGGAAIDGAQVVDVVRLRQEQLAELPHLAGAFGIHEI